MEFTWKDGTKVQCLEPPPDVISKGVKAEAELAAQKVGTLLKGTGGAEVDIEKIRRELPADVSSFEVIEYRICAQYGNQVLSKEEYRSFTERILPAMRESTPAKPVSDSGTVSPIRLEQLCNRPATQLKRRPEVFTPSWLSVLNGLRQERNVHDLQNLFEVWGRRSVGLEGKDLIREAAFVLKCLEEKGELRMEKLGVTGTYWGESFENERITFRNP